jgi:hypothetical protein
MSKMVRNLLMGFTLVCIVFLAVLAVELFRLNSSGEGSGTSAAGAPGSTQPFSTEDTTPPAGETTPPEDDPPTDSTESAQNTDTGPPPSPTGTRHEMLLQTDPMLYLIAFADEDLFVFSEMGGDSGDMSFVYSGSTASLDICYAYIPFGQSIAEASFLDRNVFSAETLVEDTHAIGRSELSGDFVTVESGGETHEAWFYTLGSDTTGDIGVAFILKYKSDAQKEAIYSILDSVALVP